jgi:hypothetical protein
MVTSNSTVFKEANLYSIRKEDSRNASKNDGTAGRSVFNHKETTSKGIRYADLQACKCISSGQRSDTFRTGQIHVRADTEERSRYTSNAFETSTREEGCQHCRPAFLPPRKRNCFHCTGSWVCVVAGQGGCGKSRPTMRSRSWTIQPVANSYND